jgi:branched-chain amino acid transport system permease protein
MNILNIAHGSFVMIGGFITFSIVTTWGWNPLFTLPIAAAGLFAFGFTFYRYVLVLLATTSIFMVFIFTFGLDMALENLGVLIWGATSHTVPSSFQGSHITIGDAVLPIGHLVVLVASWFLGGLLYWMMRHTKFGLAMQATALDADSARLSGVDVRFVCALTFGLSAALGGAAGSLLSIVQPISPRMGLEVIGLAFVTSVLGGLGNVPGALVAGLLLAAIQSLTTLWFNAQYAQLTPFLVLLVILVNRPQGLFGRKHFAEVQF